MTNEQIADQASARIDQAELLEEDKAVNEIYNEQEKRENLQRTLDETIYTLKQESDALNRLLDRMITTSEERNKIVKDTIIKLYKLID